MRLSPSLAGTRLLFAASLFAAAVASAGTPRVAWAEVDAEAARAAAKAKLVKGTLYMDAGSYSRALAEFEEAYRIFPSPKIFFNIGLANLRLSRPAEALRAFERFLSEAVEADPQNIAQAKVQAAKVRTLVAVVEVVGASGDDGADVSVDDRAAGRLPLDEPLYVPPGKHRLVVKGGGRAEPFVKELDVGGGERAKVEVPFARKPVPVVVKVSPPVAPLVGVAETTPKGRALPPHLADETLVDKPGSRESESPLYQKPWFWAAAAGIVAATGVTLWLTLGRGVDYRDGTLPGESLLSARPGQ